MVAYICKFQNIRVLEQIFSRVDVVFAIDDTNNPFLEWKNSIKFIIRRGAPKNDAILHVGKSKRKVQCSQRRIS